MRILLENYISEINEVVNKMMEFYKLCFSKPFIKKSELERIGESCKDVTRYNNHTNSEVLINDGDDIGLFEVNRNLSRKWNELDVDHNLAIKGPNELRAHLIDIARNGADLYEIVLRKYKNYFLSDSGFIQRDIRFIRGLYCIQQMARSLQEKYALYSRTKHAYVNITIISVWIGNDQIYQEMMNVSLLKNDLKNKIIDNNKLTNKDFEDKRKKIKEGIINVAKAEDNLYISKKKD
ncbi:hypothetical protein Mgra_00003789 [Meloidogyne graminicola]|uniref:Uncharacterized protein n=1 Tax=Meloidogyne graminicola TaxID=189291 RepID=A0A8S9ZTL8_9BILA|nr:hypothetical protein Mgra_00003789 [Meloidogyne graminicola]